MNQKIRKKQPVPKYVYYCKNCENDFEIRHPLQETCTVCKICGDVDALERKPTEIFLTKKQDNVTQTSEAGRLVNEVIEETKQELKQEQDVLKNRVYKK